ncbi:MAG: 16S rRNA (guanine(527)-N(7))-methyltransferase RsmG [Chloroflexota bacterium]
MIEHMAELPENPTDNTMNLVDSGCRELGIGLSDKQLAQFALYFHELVEWNQKFNLTSIIECGDVQVKHFLDSVASLPIIAEELNVHLPFSQSYHMVDVGTGAGFPGIPLKIIEPSLKLTLMDGTGKKIRFLSQLITKLGLPKAELVQGRAEELGRQMGYRGQFDLVVARAVAPLNTLVEYLLPLTRRNGFTVIYKGANSPEEFMESRNAISVLGGEMVRFAPVHVPYLDQKRFILLIKKVDRTPDQYPRGQGLARKSPL